MLTLDKIYQASYALKTVIRRTDLISAPNINPESHIFLKPENLQVTGSFKVRGACFKIAQLTEEEKSHGVVACSAGNHAQGVALAATAHGIKSLICLPDNAPISKVEATKSYGADVCLVEGVYDDAYNKALQLKDEKGYTFIHPFDDEDVIAGQGTIGLELLEQLPEVEAVIIPIGGGGLISGVAYAIKNLNPDIRVYGVQAKGAPSMLNSIEHGKIERLEGVRTIADGIAVKEPGIHTFDLCQQYVDEIVSVTDDEISTAILALIEQHKLIAEGAGAVAVAAYVDNSVINDVSEMSWKMPERLFCRGNELYAFDAGIKMFDAATLTGFDLIASKEHLGCDDGNHDVTNRVLNVYKAATSRGYNFSGCENYLAFVSEGILYRYDIENQNCQKLCRTSADSIFATDKGVYLLTRDVPSSWLEFYDYAECKIVRGFSVDSADKVYHVCGDCDFYLGDGPIVKRVHKENDSGTTVTLFSNMASSIVYAYDDCIMYTSNGFLNMLSYTTGKKVTLTSGVVCRKAIDVGVIRHKVKYETIPAGFVRIGK